MTEPQKEYDKEYERKKRAKTADKITRREVRGRHNSCYNPEGIIVCGDGTMHDPVSGETVKPERERK